MAKLYGVNTGNLNKAVTRNIERFIKDFIFLLSQKEVNLIFQNGISSWGGTRKRPRAFTLLGVAMLSSVLRSKKAQKQNRQFVLTLISLAKEEDLKKWYRE